MKKTRNRNLHRLKLNFLHLYPNMTSYYGDRGNMIALAMRARWRGFSVDVTNTFVGDKLKINNADCIVIEGGQGSAQRKIISKDLLQKRSEIHYCAEKRIPILAICAGFQLLGKYCLTPEGERVQGIGLLDVWTITGKKRMVGPIALEARLGGFYKTIVGFENHTGKTFLGAEALPFGKVLKGYGNNGQDGKEGVIYKNVLGTYLHGPLLPKNPWLADYILKKAIDNKYPGMRLKLLNNKFETAAHHKMLKKLALKR